MNGKVSLVRLFTCCAVAIALVLPTLAADKKADKKAADTKSPEKKKKKKKSENESPNPNPTVGEGGVGGNLDQDAAAILANLRLWFKAKDLGDKGYLDRYDLARAFNYNDTWDDGKKKKDDKPKSDKDADKDGDKDKDKDKDKTDGSENSARVTTDPKTGAVIIESDAKKDDKPKANKKATDAKDKKDDKADKDKKDGDKEAEETNKKELDEEKEEAKKHPPDKSYIVRRDFKMLTILDKDGDERISKEEFEVWAKEYAVRLARYYDALGQAPPPGAGSDPSGPAPGSKNPGKQAKDPNARTNNNNNNNNNGFDRNFERSLMNSVGRLQRDNQNLRNQNQNQNQNTHNQKGQTSSNHGKTSGGKK